MRDSKRGKRNMRAGAGDALAALASMASALPAEPVAPHSATAAGRLLGIDYGLARIGLAVCDPDWRFASPLDQYTRRTPDLDTEYFRDLVEREQFAGAVVGIPLDTGGGENSGTALCRAFGERLREATGIDVFYFDERCTTVAAEEMLWAAGLRHSERKARRDKLAATLILQAFIDSAREVLSDTQES